MLGCNTYSLLSVILPLVLAADQPHRIWILQASSKYAGMSYIDTDSVHRGFGLDIAYAVCQEAGIDCRVVRTDVSDCWSTNPGDRPSGGRGLFGRWYDVCLNRFPTIERIHAFQFSLPYTKPKLSYMWVLRGNTFNAHDFRGQVVGVRKGTIMDETCLARHDVHFTPTSDNTVFLVYASEYLGALQDHRVDGIFTNEEVWSDEDRKLVEKVSGPEFDCSLGGLGVMARKDSHFIANWNVGFNKLRNSPKWAKLCKESTEKHGYLGVSKCVD